MEVIRIPQVGLIDATGRNIGIYSDNPDWWQKLKQNNKLIAIQPSNMATNERQATPVGDVTLKTKLIKKDDFAAKNDITDDENDAVKFASAETNKVVEECNVIGETPLHIAIMYEDMNTLRVLIEEKGYDVNERSTNDAFSSGFNSKITAKLISQSKYESLAYFGEYPLAFAACFANKEIYDYLIEKGADPNLQGLT